VAVDQRDALLLDHSVDNLLEVVDKALDKVNPSDENSWEQYHRTIEESVDQVLQQMNSDQWTVLSNGGMNETTPDLNYSERIKLIRLARLYYLKDPLIHQATSLITNYTFADGFRYSCNEEPWKEILDDWWNDEDNLMELTSQQAQEQKSIELIVDGEIFFVIFREPDGRVKIRTLPPEEIVDVITSPNDYRRNLYYQRRFIPQVYNFKEGQYEPGQSQKITYYADWRNYEAGNWGFEKGLGSVQEGGIYQIATNRISRQKRGNTETYPALDWVKAHRQMLQDWVTIVRAYSTLAWKAKVKGDDGRDLQRIKDKLAGLLPVHNATTGQIGQPSGVGGVAFENDQVSMSPMKTAGMATDPGDARQIRLMAGAGLGIMEHYFGDAGNANLATAQAMELPMLKKFAARQRYWEDIFKNIMTYVIISAIESGRVTGKVDYNKNTEGLLVSKRLVKENDKQVLVIQAPAILQKNLAEVSQGIVPLVTNNLVPWEEAARYSMKALDLENVEEALVLLREEKAANERKAAEIMQKELDAKNQPPPPGDNPPGDQNPQPATGQNKPSDPPAGSAAAK
jgi:hypothetical protein